MVLGFQGKGQVEALYGHVAEAMLSQPATKIFLKTSEPHASEWISKAIGEIEIERFRESRTVGKFPRNSENESRDITREPLVILIPSPAQAVLDEAAAPHKIGGHESQRGGVRVAEQRACGAAKTPLRLIRLIRSFTMAGGLVCAHSPDCGPLDPVKTSKLT
jgi:hypothetical protein